MMSLWDALRMNMMISYQELVRTFLRKNATLYEVYHEVIHAKQFAKIGREAYEALGRLSREEHVLNEILKSKNLFNEAEIAHAIKYVEGLREKFMMGLTN